MRTDLEIYQVRAGEKYDAYRNIPFQDFAKTHSAPNPKYYAKVYVTRLQSQASPYSIYRKFLSDPPENFSGHPVKTGTIFVLKTGKVIEAYYVDMGTVIAIPGFRYGIKAAIERDMETETQQSRARDVKDDAAKPARLVKHTIAARLHANKAESDRQEEERKQGHIRQQEEENAKNRSCGLTI